MSATLLHSHTGAYAILRCGNHVLLVLKARGPYTGTWDLPGGRIEFGEAPKDTVRREVQEETGIIVANVQLSATLSHVIDWTTPQGEAERLHHVGILYTASDTGGSLQQNGDQQDAAQARWHDIKTPDKARLTPFARRALLEGT